MSAAIAIDDFCVPTDSDQISILPEANRQNIAYGWLNTESNKVVAVDTAEKGATVLMNAVGVCEYDESSPPIF
jgi:hypothetical protein